MNNPLRLRIVFGAGLFAVCHTGFCQERPDAPKAMEFLHRLQNAVQNNDRKTIADMTNYPVFVYLHGQRTTLRNRDALLRNFDLVFDQEVRCAILSAEDGETHAFKFGYVVHLGEINFERFIPAGYRGNSDSADFWNVGAFKIRAIRNGWSLKTCSIKAD